MIYSFKCEDCEEKFDEFFYHKDKKEPLCPKCGSKNTHRDFLTELKSKIVMVYDDSSGFNVSEGVYYKDRKDLQKKVYNRGHEFMDGHGLGKKQTPIYVDEINRDRDERLSNQIKAPEVIIE